MVDSVYVLYNKEHLLYVFYYKLLWIVLKKFECIVFSR